MAKVLSFPQSERQVDPGIAAMESIEKRYGMSFWEYMGFTGNQDEVQQKIDRQLRKETLQIATNIIEGK